MLPTSKMLLALALAGSVALAACGGGDDAAPAQSGESLAVRDEGGTGEPPAVDPPSPASDAPAVDDEAAVLFADLAGALHDHVYLAGITIEAAIDAGGDLNAPPVSTARSALDDNTQAIADLVASFAGDDQRDAFVGLWDDHIDSFADYALATAEGDDPGAGAALEELDAYKEAAGAFFEEATGGQLAADAVIDTLDGHVGSVLDAIDAIVADDPQAVEDLQRAAQHMQGAAEAIAGAVVTAMPDEFPGDVMSAAAENHATIAVLLREHVFLTGIAVEQAVEAGESVDGLAIESIQPAIEENTGALADAIGVATDSEWEAAFTELWTDHQSSLVEYGVGTATGDQGMAESARTRIEGFRVGMAALLEDVTPNPADAAQLVDAFEDINVSMIGAVDAIVAGDPAAVTLLAETAREASLAALEIARAVTIAS